MKFARSSHRDRFIKLIVNYFLVKIILFKLPYIQSKDIFIPKTIDHKEFLNTGNYENVNLEIKNLSLVDLGSNKNFPLNEVNYSGQLEKNKTIRDILIKKENDILSIINSSSYLIDDITTKFNTTHKMKKKIKKKDKSVVKRNSTNSFPFRTKSRDKKHKKKIKYDNSLNFYNSLSLVMLAILSGGLVGVVFILYASSKNAD